LVGLKHAVLVAPAAMVVGSVAMTSTAAAEDGFRFYGFLNGAVTSVDDGVQRRNEFSDNSNAPSRIGAWYEMGTNAGTLKFNFETALGLRGTSSLSMGSNDDFFDWDTKPICGSLKRSMKPSVSERFMWVRGRWRQTAFRAGPICLAPI
jgi:hypothetical protein